MPSKGRKSGSKKKSASKASTRPRFPPEIAALIVKHVHELELFDDGDLDEDEDEDDEDEMTRRLFEQFVLKKSGGLTELSEKQLVKQLADLRTSGDLEGVVAEFEDSLRKTRVERNDPHKFEEWGKHRMPTLEALSRTNKMWYELVAPLLWEYVDFGGKSTIDLLYFHEVILPRHSSDIVSLRTLDFSDYSGRPLIPSYITSALSLPSQSITPNKSQSSSSASSSERADVRVLGGELLPSPTKLPSGPPSSRSHILYQAQIETILSQRTNLIERIILLLPELRGIELALDPEDGKLEDHLRGLNWDEKGLGDTIEELEISINEVDEVRPVLKQEAVATLISAMKGLKVLDVNLEIVTGSGNAIVDAAVALEKLEKLAMEGVGSEIMQSFLEEDKEWKGALKIVDLNCETVEVREKSIVLFLKKFETSLEAFNLSSDPLDDQAPTENLTPLPTLNLTKLDTLALSTALPSSFLSSFSSSPLTDFELGHCPHITFEALEAFLRTHAPTLETVTIASMRNVSVSELERLEEWGEENKIEVFAEVEEDDDEFEVDEDDDWEDDEIDEDEEPETDEDE